MRNTLLAALAGVCMAGTSLAGSYTGAVVIPDRVCSGKVSPEVVTIGQSTYYPLTLTRVAEEVNKDPTGIWGKRIRNFNNPNGTDIWVGTVNLCDGQQIIVSQFMNRQCSSETTCPMRVIRNNEGEKDDMLVQYQQACTDHEMWYIRTDGRGIMTCREQRFWKDK